MNQSRVKKALEDFYLATYLPIIQLTQEGHIIRSAGYNDPINNIFDLKSISYKLIKELHGNKSTTTYTIKGVHFTASYICQRNLDRGIIILGPYSDDIDNDLNVVYKPKSLIPHLFGLFHSLWRNVYNEKHEDIEVKAYSLHVKKAMDYSNVNYQSDISLTTLSEYLQVNKCYFCSLFKSETGKTFTQFLNELRVEKSKELLIKDDTSILDIALNVGFNSQNYYNIVFKKVTNQTPLEYRNGNSSSS